jgi:putative DNA primase/helicase
MATKKPRYSAEKAVLANLPPPKDEAANYWEANLELTDKLRIVASLRNAFLILTKDDRWAGVLAYDEFSNQVMKLSKPPFDGGEAGPWGDVDDLRAAIWLSQHYRVNFKKSMITDVATAAANELRFHPVRDYFTGLTWDGQERLPTLLAKYLGADEGEYARAVGMKFLIGAVARVMRPGCKMDNVLILEGKQGRWKSTALAAIAGEWFMDTPFTIGDKDAYLALRGKLIVEMPELDTLARAEASRAKAFFSSSSDTFRAPYQAWARTVPRQCVFAGTVNHGTYLRDTTGNRRYWPVRVRFALLDELRADRDQIWAEAVARFTQGTPWWVLQEERSAFEDQQQLRYVGDAFEQKVGDFLVGKNETTMLEILADCLKLDPSKWTRAEQSRVGEVLQALGWEKKRHATGKRDYYYARAEREPGEEG